MDIREKSTVNLGASFVGSSELNEMLPLPRVELLPSGLFYRCGRDETLLEAALGAGIKLPYGCAVGNCGSCRCKLVEGFVTSISDDERTLSEKDRADGYILTCQSRAASPVIRLEFPDLSASGVPGRRETRGAIVARRPLTHDILEVKLNLDEPISFLAGQFAQIGVDGIKKARCYSFSHRPAQNGQKQVSFFIRKVPGGAFTEKLFSGELDGEPLALTAPGGEFYLREGKGALLCIAGGSGLAPVLSILEDAAKKRIERDCVLVFGARTGADVYGMDRLESIARRWCGRFHHVIALSAENNETAELGFVRGFVTDHIESSVAALQVRIAEVDTYMAGPPAMIDAALNKFDAIGLTRSKIYFDRFTDESYGR